MSTYEAVSGRADRGETAHGRCAEDRHHGQAVCGGQPRLCSTPALSLAGHVRRYETWQLGALRLLTRAATRARAPPLHPAPNPKTPPATWAEAVAGAAGPGPGSDPDPDPAPALVMRASAEYLGEAEADEEETTAAETARWWAALRVRPGAQLLVRHGMNFRV